MAKTIEGIAGESWISVPAPGSQHHPHVGGVVQLQVVDPVLDHSERMPKVDFQHSVVANVAAAGEGSARTCPRLPGLPVETVTFKNWVQ